MKTSEKPGTLLAGFCWAAITGAMLAATACAPITPAFDQHFGQAVPVLRAQQVANPQAGIDNQSRTVTGMDGRAAREAVDRYYRSFKEPPPPVNTFNIGVGSAQGTGAQ